MPASPTTTTAATEPEHQQLWAARGSPDTRLVLGIRLRSISALWLRHWLAFIRFWKYALAFMVVEPVAMLVGVAFGVGRLVDNVPGTDVPYAEFVASGLVIGSAMFVPLIECSMSAYNRMDNQLYDTQLTAPLSITEVLIADLAFACTRGLISAISITTVALIFGWINEWTAIYLVIPVILTGILFGSIGFLFSTTAPHVAFVSLIFTVIGTPLFMFSGIFYPFEVLPNWARIVSLFIPLRPAVDLGRDFATNSMNAGMAWDILAMLAMIAVAAPAAGWLLKRKLVK